VARVLVVGRFVARERRTERRRDIELRRLGLELRELGQLQRLEQHRLRQLRRIELRLLQWCLQLRWL
jgi:hypothetical protein